MTRVIRPSDPMFIIAGIRQFGLAADGSDLRDLEAALERIGRDVGEQARLYAEREARLQKRVGALTAERNRIRDDLDTAIGHIGRCLRALENADCAPEAFGVGGSDEGTNWYIKDELEASMRRFLERMEGPDGR